MSDTVDLDLLRQWEGRRERRIDMLTADTMARLAALLDYDAPPWPEGEAPPFGHWCAFLPTARQSLLDRDGHPARGDFLPPVPLPRRMWAGGRLTFGAPLPLDRPVERVSSIIRVDAKNGATGPLVFVTVRHDYAVEGAVRLSEEQDLVYRAADAGGSPPATSDPARFDADFERSVQPSPVLLFRYSALTFNAHRIHYDRDYATREEGHRGLIVHGPLVATLLLDLLHRAGWHGRVGDFSFRARKPLDDLAPFDLCGRRDEAKVELWTRGAAGDRTMTADATMMD